MTVQGGGFTPRVAKDSSTSRSKWTPITTSASHEWDKLFVANSANGHVDVYGGDKFTLLGTIDFGEGSDPDNLRYDSVAKKVYLGYGDGAIAVIDPVTNKRLATEYKFEGHPEGFQLETKASALAPASGTQSVTAST